MKTTIKKWLGAGGIATAALLALLGTEQAMAAPNITQIKIIDSVLRWFKVQFIPFLLFALAAIYAPLAQAVPAYSEYPQSWVISADRLSAVGTTASGVVVTATLTGPNTFGRAGSMMYVGDPPSYIPTTTSAALSVNNLCTVTGVSNSGCGSITYTFSRPVTTPILYATDMIAYTTSSTGGIGTIASYQDNRITLPASHTFVLDTPGSQTANMGIINSNQTIGITTPPVIGTTQANPNSCGPVMGCGSYDIITPTATITSLTMLFGSNTTANQLNGIPMILGTTPVSPTINTVKIADKTTAAAGESVRFTVASTNTSTSPSTLPTVIEDVIPVGLTVNTITGINGYNCVPSSPLPLVGNGTTSKITCTATAVAIPPMAANFGTMIIQATKTTNNTVTNTATMTSGDSTCPAAAHCTATAVVNGVAEITVSKLLTSPANTNIVGVGETARFVIATTNTSNVASSLPTVVEDVVPTGLTVTQITGINGYNCVPSSALPLVGNGTTSKVTCTATAVAVPPMAANFGVVMLNTIKTAGGTVTNTSNMRQGDPACPAAARCTGTVTITSPDIAVTKTVSQPVLVAGKTGQFYTVNIAVSNGPTTAPIQLTDVLPTGITLSGAPTATGGTLSGCPSTGGSLAGCTIAAGAANGTVVVTVPINVGATATTGTNTATVAGGGSVCGVTTIPQPTNCASTVIAPVIDAVNDTDSKQPNVPSTTNIAPNDKYPSGSTFTVQPGGTCGAPIAVSAAGVASYTSPATAGATCTVNYQVCAPAPNAAVCDTATLTVTAEAAPALSVTKTATPAVLVVGGSNQSYTITIEVANGPTTQAITIADALPAGITTSGAITATGGTLSGCPATGATNLTGCSIAAGVATGNIVITVPVSVASAAANPSTNTVTASGGGDPTCPADCTATVITPVIDAVNDTDSKQPNVPSTTNIAPNDKYPSGSTFTVQPGGTCGAPIAVSAAGVASYTSPATAGATCTVNYQVCAPAPNAAVCDTATLTVTAEAAPALSVTKTATPAVLVVGGSNQSYTITIEVANGPTTQAITIADALPTGITTSGAITATGGTLSGCPATGATNLTGCSIAAGVATGNIVITVPVSVASTARDPSINTATASGGGDPTCPADCTATVITPVIDAVNDTDTKQPNVPSTTNIAPNDKYPSGSTFTVQPGGSCGAPIAVSAAGVASYTSPATAGATCTVNYQVCAPAPNASICDTAVLTVTAGTAPALTVTKTSTPAVLVVGGSNQSYTITIAVANGPTTQAITIADALPAGITTSGAITATGGTLSGCPATGASNLTGCSIAAGVATGNIVVTVPVSVASAAANPSTNTATASGGGDPTCTGTAPACTGTVTTPVIDAVNDTDSKQPNVPSTTNIAPNDKYPSGSTFTVQPGGTCGAPIAVSAAGVASYTSPATAGATCTVNYQVCAPAPNAAVCDTATLTVTAGTAPALSVTKTATPAVLVVGGSNQTYTITIAVANGPTTQAITIADALPAGITTSGAITATGGTLSGCPATGATNLTGCSIAAGAATGNIVITVPVSVAAAAANPSTNTATASGGGDPSCTPATGANCTGTVNTPVIGAVMDTDTKQPNVPATTNIAPNDKYPSGSTFTVQPGGSCGAPIAVSTAGVASYTSPATAGATCTVNYRVCAPAPNASICDTAVLTVTAGAAPILTVVKTVSTPVLKAGQTGQYYTISVTVANGPTTAPTLVTDVLPAGITLSGAPTATGGTLSGCPSSGDTLAGCTIATGAANGTVVITVPVTVAATAGTGANTAHVSGGGSACTGTETSGPCVSTVGATIDAVISVIKTADKTSANENDVVTYSIKANNGSGAASSLPTIVEDVLPVGLTVQAASNVTAGTGFSCVGSTGSYPLVGNGTTSKIVCTSTATPIAANASGQNVATVAATMTTGNGGEITNVARVTAGDPLCATAAASASGRCTSRVTVQAIATPAAVIVPVRVEKTTNTSVVEIGDTLRYTVTIHNDSNITATKMVAIDTLPLGFSYIDGTATYNGATIADPTGKPGATLNFTLPGSIAGGTSVSLTYRVRVGVAATKGTGTNQVRITSNGATASGTAVATVKVIDGVFNTSSCILGSVFSDTDGNGVKNAGEYGLPGVRFYLDDGTSVVSDVNGRYSLCGVSARSHVLAVDRNTLPRDCELRTTSNRNLGDAASLWIDSKMGELTRGDFICKLAPPAPPARPDIVTPPAPPPPPPPPPKPAQFRRVLLEADALFAYDKRYMADVLPGAIPRLNALADALNKSKNVEKIEILGHTDRMASEEYNMRLGQDRANTIKAYLVSKGIPAEKMVATSKGELVPVVFCQGTAKTPLLISCLQPNRRVEINTWAEVIEPIKD